MSDAIGEAPGEIASGPEGAQEIPSISAALPLPALKKYKATLLIEREVTVSAASDSDFEEAVLRIMKNELDPKKYRLVQIASKTSAAQWS